jgi:3-ketosteroid 9alpha-monooxygenase subunit A
MGCIWAWHDPENGEPDYEVPDFVEWNDPQWVRCKIVLMGTIELHPQDVLDNMADVAHLNPVHGSTVEYFENEFRDHVVIQRQGGGHRTLVTTSGMLETDTWYTGPAILYSKLTGLYDTLMLITHTPVDDGVLKVWHALLVKSPNRIATAEDVASARAYQESSRLAFAQDFDIWAHKRPCINPLQIPTDGPFHKGRVWYGQFYNPRARAPEFHRKVNGVHVVKGMPAAPKRVGAA